MEGIPLDHFVFSYFPERKNKGRPGFCSFPIGLLSDVNQNFAFFVDYFNYCCFQSVLGGVRL